MTDSDTRKPALRPLRDEITDLPNVITLIRILMIPLILIWIDNYSRWHSTMAAVIFIVAAATDVLDGYLARRMGLVTIVGKFLDPLADKLIVLCTLVMLVAKGRAPAWLVIILMTRELAITGLRAIASQQGFVIAAGAGGKAKTALQAAGIVFLLVHFPYDLLLFDYTLDFHEVGIYLLYLSLVMSVLSAFEYFRFFVLAADQQAEEMAAQGITRQKIKQRLRAERMSAREMKATRKREKRERRRDKIRANRDRRRSRSLRRQTPPKEES